MDWRDIDRSERHTFIRLKDNDGDARQIQSKHGRRLQ